MYMYVHVQTWADPHTKVRRQPSTLCEIVSFVVHWWINPAIWPMNFLEFSCLPSARCTVVHAFVRDSRVLNSHPYTCMESALLTDLFPTPFHLIFWDKDLLPEPEAQWFQLDWLVSELLAPVFMEKKISLMRDTNLISDSGKCYKHKYTW